jgi:anthranilate 3-monooxygenase (FAD) / 4-hydroxyphenylacetate 3-monooxygenase
LHIADMIGRADALHVQAQIGELVANVELVDGLVRAGAEEVAASTHGRVAHRSTSAALWVLVPQCQMRAVQVIRELSGSGLIMTPTEKDFAHPEIAPDLEKYLRGKTVSALDRVQLFKLAWDIIGEQFGARQLQYEWFYAGDPYFTRQRFFHSVAATEYREIVTHLLRKVRKPQE